MALKKIIRWLVLLNGPFLACGMALASQTTTYFGPGGSDLSGDGSSGNWYFSSTKAYSVGGGGNEFIEKAGTWTLRTTTAPAGNLQGGVTFYTITKCETPGACIATGGLDLTNSGANGGLTLAQWEGIVWTSTDQKHIEGSYLRFFSCGFSSGPPNGNNAALAIGSNNFATYTNHILMEDCYHWGPGGRYNVLIYNTSDIMVRRAIIRHDGGWTDALDPSDPEAGITVYDSSGVAIENTIIIDSTQTYATWQGSFYVAQHANGATLTLDKLYWMGDISLNAHGAAAWNLDAPFSSGTIKDSVAWDIQGSQGIGFSFGNSGSTVTALGVTTGFSKQSPGASSFGFYEQGANISTVTNAIITGFTGGSSGDFSGVSRHTYFDVFNCGNTSNGTGRQTYDPTLHGLVYLNRIETGLGLSTAGINSTTMGADIRFQYGVSGTYYGEPGWDTLTAVPLWPYSQEATAAAFMKQNENFGFAADTSATPLTHDVENYLGNGCPDCTGGGQGGGSTPGALPTINIQGITAQGIKFGT